MADARELLLRQLLNEISKQQNYEPAQFSVTPIPPTGSNFTSQLFHATISAPENQDLKVFAKVAVIGELMRAQAPTKIFDIERHVYTKLAKIYSEIEEKHNVPIEHRLVMPKIYSYNDKFLEEALVLQDLSAEGFTTYDRLKSVDWEYASKSVEELAKLHALSIAYQNEYSNDYNEAKKLLKRELMEESPAVLGMIQQMMDSVMKVVREEHRDRLLKTLTETMKPELFVKYYEPFRRPVLVHSDFRQSNLMHKTHKNGSLQVVIVDYQTMHPGSAAIDLLYFIFTGSDGAFRKEHYSRLIDHYYEHMAEALRRLHLDPDVVFPKEDFDFELKEVLPFGLIIAVMMMPMITVDMEHVSQTTETVSMESMLSVLTKTNELCAERVNEVIDDYVTWGLV